MLKTWVEVVTLDRSGRVVRRQKVNGRHSWVKQWVQILRGHLNWANEAGVVDTSAAAQTINSPANNAAHTGPASNGGVGDDTKGILVGTGNAAPTRDDTNLQAKIAHGVGAGQLEYQGTNFSLVAVAGGYRVTISRQFNNNSGADITVNEIGIAAEHTLAAGGTARFLIMRDLVSPGALLPNGGSKIFRIHLDFLV